MCRVWLRPVGAAALTFTCLGPMLFDAMPPMAHVGPQLGGVLPSICGGQLRRGAMKANVP